MEKTKEIDRAPAVPRRTMAPIEREVGRFIEEFFRPFGRGIGQPLRILEDVRVPAVEVYEEKDDVVIKAELPGMNKQDIQVNLSDHHLILRGEKKEEEQLKDKGFYYSERTFGAFERSIEIPRDVQADKARATFKDGI